MRGVVRPVTGSPVATQRDRRDGARAVRFPPAFTPQSLFANGEIGAIYDPADEGSLWSDYAGTTNLIVDAGGVIANIHDLSGNGFHGSRLSVGLRPKMQLLTANGSYRRGVQYDGLDDALNLPLPNMGTNCTIIRARAGIGAVKSTGQTISGALNDNTNFNALIVIDRPLTPEGDANAMVWAQQRSGMADELNQVYGPDATNEKCDVFHSSGHPARPIIIMVHGGGWRNGSKASPNVTKNKLQHWLPRGFTFVSVGYKLDVGTDPIDQARSVARCVAWVQAQARAWGCNPSNIVLMGHSAGGHLVGLVSAKKALRDAEGMGPWLGTVCIDSAAYDVQAIMERVGHLTLYDEPWGIGQTQHWIDGSPTFQLDCTPPPMLLITSTDSNPGEADQNVGPFRDAVNAKPGGSATILHTALDHGACNTDMGLLGAYTDSIDAFFTSIGLG